MWDEGGKVAPEKRVLSALAEPLAPSYHKDHFQRLLLLEWTSIPISEYRTGDEPGPSYQLFGPGSRQKTQRAARSDGHIGKFKLLLKGNQFSEFGRNL